ncbi:MAG TPA: DUF6282 family protein [Candidatus Saccharimonadales bacterium]|nr:DUF6282 family protein [Candidatus Saccharimonadales bacterium]
MKIKDIIKQAIDIHVHVGPEPIPRKYTVESLVSSQQNKIGGFVLKNHFNSTAPLIKQLRSKGGLKVFGSVVLNNSIGGLNSEAVYTAGLLSDSPLFVWFPTINAENFLRKSEYEIAPEWTKGKTFTNRKASDVTAVKIVDKRKLTKEAIEVLKAIKKTNSVLATGHLSWKESQLLIAEALEMGIKRIVITHPIYQKINMPLSIQKELANKGCFIEQCFSMYAIDKIPISKIAKQIKQVGASAIILSSDVGQIFSPPPNIALQQFANSLRAEGTSADELFSMLVENPKALLGVA